MTRYRALAIKTSYWKPKSGYTTHIAEALQGKVRDGDFVVVSEKALVIASNYIIDESNVEPSLNSKFLATFWMRFVWGYCIGTLCGFGYRLLRRLREYPLDSSSRHKQIALKQTGLMQALMFSSEKNIDGSNLAYSYVSLPLRNADVLAQNLRRALYGSLGKDVCVIIADTDKTYKFRNFYFTPRPNPLRGIHSFGGIVAYVIGRMLKLKRSSTPLAVAGCALGPAEALAITNIADRTRGPGAGATVWDMAARFKVDINEVSWEMLESLGHKPIVIVRGCLQ